MTCLHKPTSTAVRCAVLALVAGGIVLPPVVTATVAHAEQAVAPEKNPPGDIPDSQVFIDYKSPLGFSLKVPEGWARSDHADGVDFTDKLDGVTAAMTKVVSVPTLESIKADYISGMKKAGRAIKVNDVKAVKLPAGQAIRIAYSSNSDPNPVTGKQVRLENNRYLYFKGGNLIALDLYAPLGADNVDQWQLMSQSFRWN